RSRGFGAHADSGQIGRHRDSGTGTRTARRERGTSIWRNKRHEAKRTRIGTRVIAVESITHQRTTSELRAQLRPVTGWQANGKKAGKFGERSLDEDDCAGL